MVLEMLKFCISLAFLLLKLQLIKAASDINICENVADHIFIQDVNDCTKYFVCVDGQAISQKCRRGLYFDAKLQACTVSRQGCLKCPGRQMINVPLLKTCNKYILCYYGNPSLRKCENNQQFNRRTGKCDYAQNVDCVDDRCSIHPVDNDLIYMASAASCEKYYVCVAGQAKSMTCAAGLKFSTKCNCCDKAENVGCKIELIDVPDQINNKTNRLHNTFSQKLHTPRLVGESKWLKCPPVGYFLYPYIGNPEYYFRCVGGKATLFACASGFQFDDIQKRCVSKSDEVEETFDYDINGNTERKTQERKIQCPEFGAAIMPHKNITKYILCVGGNATVFDCPAEHYFDTTENFCRNNSEMKRKRYGSVVDEFAGIVCPKYATFTFPHQDKHKFYLCLDGKATVFTCADGQYFDISVHGCREELQEEEFNLNITSLNSKEFDLINNPFDVICPPTGNTTLPHAQRNQYYLCVEGKSAIFACAEGLLYDEKLKNCTENATSLVDELEVYTPEITNIMCPKFGTFKFPHATKTKYYLCIDGKTYILACAKNEYFDADINICRLNETLEEENNTLFLQEQNNTLFLQEQNNTLFLQEQNNTLFLQERNNTIKNNTRTTLTSVATELARNFVCPMSGTFIFPHAQRNRYYVCIDGNAVVFTCTGGHSFDTETNTCKRDTNILEEDIELESPVVLDEPVNILCPSVGAIKFEHEEKHKFYLCVNGMASVLACANDSFYDHESGACRRDFFLANNTRIVDTEMLTQNTTSEFNTTLAEVDTFVKCPLRGTFIYPHNESNKYYVCLDGQVIHLTCPNGSLYDSEEKACRIPIQKENVIDLPPKVINETVTILCPASGVHKYPHVEDDKFYLCINGMGSVLACPENSRFDEETGNCYENDINQVFGFNNLTSANTTLLNQTFAYNNLTLSNTTIASNRLANVTANATEIETLNITCPKLGTFMYPLEDKQKYAVCLDGKALELICPENFVFDSKLKKCRDSYGGKLENLIDIAPTVINETVSIMCPASGVHKYPHVEENKFYLCLNGVGSVLACPQGSMLNEEMGNCQGVYAELVFENKNLTSNNTTILNENATIYCPIGSQFDEKTYSCQRLNITELTSNDTNLINENITIIAKDTELLNITCPKVGTFLYPLEDSQKYAVCLNGSAVKFTCPENFVFDYKINKCFEDSTRKQDNVLDLSPSIINETVTILCPATGVHKYPHVEYDKFYLCINGMGSVLACPESSRFDKETGNCYENDINQVFGFNNLTSANTTLLNQTFAYNNLTLSNTTIASNRLANVTANGTEIEILNITCPKLGTFMYPLEDKQKYAVCLDGIALEFTCPENFVFDSNLKKCRENYGGKQENLIDIAPTVINETVSIMCPASGIHKYPHVEENKFYLCLNGMGSVLACPQGSMLNEEIGNCQGVNAELVFENKNLTSNNTTILNENATIYCPIGSQFDEKTYSCQRLNITELTSNDTNLINENITIIAKDTELLNITCPKVGTFLYPLEDSEKYAVCLNGSAVKFTCPENFVFDYKINKCFEDSTRKQDNELDLSPSIINETVTILCPATGVHKYPHVEDHKFYLCINGMGSILACPQGSRFDEKIANCYGMKLTQAIEYNNLTSEDTTSAANRLANVTTNVTVMENSNFTLNNISSTNENITDITIKKTEIETLNITCPNLGTFLYPLEDQQKYAVCLDGIALEFTCPEDFIFDSKLNKCRQSHTGDFISPFNCPSNETAMLPHEDINKYYLCINGSAIIQTCSNNDIFDSEIKTCRAANSIEKQFKISKDIECPLFGKQKLPHIDSNKFYLCVKGIASVHSCAKGEMFDAKTETCQESQSLKKLLTKNIQCPLQGTRKIAHLDRNKYYLCIDGFSTTYSCAKGDVFDAESETCRELPANGGRAVSIDNKESKEIKCPLKGLTRLPHIERNKFYLCIHGVPIVQSCFEGDFYDNETKTCQESNFMQCPTKGERKLPHTDPHKFYLCLDGIATIHSCAQGDFFDAASEMCSEPLLTESIKKHSSEIRIGNTEDNSIKCPRQGSERFAHEEINKFYLCLNGVLTIQSCSEGSFFDMKTQTCLEYNSFENPLKDSENINCPLEGTSKIPHADPNKFYLCLDGVATVHSCFKGDFFDAESEICREPLLTENIQKQNSGIRIGNTGTPEDNVVKCPRRGSARFAHEDINKFYLCLNGVLTIQSCSEGSFFDMKTQTCLEYNSFENPLQQSENINCPLEGTSKIPHADPNKFYLCLDGIATVHSCFKGDFFDAESEICREPLLTENIQKQNSAIRIGNTGTSEDNIIKCPRRGSARFAHEDINKYYLCLNGILTIQSCSEGSFFDMKTQSCLEYNSFENPLQQSENINCPLEGTSKIPHADPNKFYLCLDGVATVHSCFKGDFFDAESEICREPLLTENIKQQNSGIRIGNTGTPEDNIIKCPRRGSARFAHEDINKFYLCLNGVLTIQSCSEGSFFDMKTQSCLEYNSFENPLQQSENINCPLEGTSKIPHADPNKFYLCLDGVATVHSCFKGDFFDAESEICREPLLTENIQKQNSGIRIGNTETPEYNIIKCPRRGSARFAHEDINKFYLCLNGVLTIQSCSEGSFFDTKTQSCLEYNSFENPLQQSENINCPLEGTSKIPHADPNKFYLCLDGVATVHSCFKGDFFDAESEICREPLLTENIKQQNSGIRIGNTGTPEDNIIKCPRRGSARFAHEDINKFYLCLNGVLTIQSCSEGSFFDMKTQSCLEYNSFENPLHQSENINCPLEGTSKIPHADPNKFYLCLDGVATVHNCFKGYFFDAESEICREPLLTENTGTPEDNIIKCPRRGSARFAHEDINKFYLCLNGVLTIQSCSEGGFFDTKTKTCLGYNSFENPLQQFENINCPLEGTSKIPHADPNKFYLCLDGIATIHSCFKGDFFDVESEMCREMLPTENDAIRSIVNTFNNNKNINETSLGNKEYRVNTENNDSTGFNSIRCPPKGSIKLPHVESNKFYLCLDGILTIQNCLEGDFFDVETETCRLKPILLNENIQCPTKGAQKLPHTDPNKFYLCLDGIATIHSCAKGDFFDVESETCLEPSTTNIKQQATVISIDNEVSNDIKCPPQGVSRFPHLDSNKFYLCIDGVAIVQSCLEGDFFDDETKTCVGSNSMQKPLKEVDNIKCPAKGTQKLRHVDPNKFYLCLDGIATILSCAKGDFFDAESEICRKSFSNENELDQTTVIPTDREETSPASFEFEETTSLPNENEEINLTSLDNKEYETTIEDKTLMEGDNIKCPAQGLAKIPHPDPNMFYLCNDGIAIIQSCAEEYFFDARSETCRESFPNRNEADQTTTIPTKSKETSPASLGYEETIAISNENDETSLTSTDNKGYEIALEVKVPNDVDYADQTTVIPTEIVEISKISIDYEETTLIPNESQEISLTSTDNKKYEMTIEDQNSIETENIKCPPQGSSIIPHSDSNKFYLCNNGIATISSCAPGDFFDVESETCREGPSLESETHQTKLNPKKSEDTNNIEQESQDTLLSKVNNAEFTKDENTNILNSGKLNTKVNTLDDFENKEVLVPKATHSETVFSEN